MAKVLITESYLSAIATAIRTKGGTVADLAPADMADAIDDLPQAAVLEAGSATANGTYTPSTGKDGFSQFTVAIPAANGQSF